MKIHIVGAGLAGSEAAHYLAARGFPVTLYEMRPQQLTEAHQTGQCAELVCSNSLKSKDPQSAPGILKQEMNYIGSLILRAAAQAEIPGGQALTVDRELFSETISSWLKKHPKIIFKNEQVLGPINDDDITLFATGPLTAPPICSWIKSHVQEQDLDIEASLYFYDAIAPIVEGSSIDQEKTFTQNRYNKGEEKAYVNCPLTKAEYEAFIDALLAAEKVQPRAFEEKEKWYTGCQPIEAIAEKGRESLRFGPMKPVGLIDPKTQKEPYAVVQLRAENASKTAYNLVGFQTKLKYGEQKRIFGMIPALKNAEFVRLGSVHRNTYLCGPKLLRPDLSLRGKPKVYFAGQITGVEGYLESAACGILAAMFIQQRIEGKSHHPPPMNTALGSLLNHVVASPSKNYQPSGIHFGLMEPIFFDNVSGLKKGELRQLMAEQSYDNFKRWIDEMTFASQVRPGLTTSTDPGLPAQKPASRG